MASILVVGSLNVDLVISVKSMPVAGETLLADHFDRIPGGKGANQAYAAAMLGAKTVMLGSIGRDESGEMLRQSLLYAGVDISRLKISGRSTGTAVITVNEAGENSIVVLQEANLDVDIAYIDANLDAIKEADIVLLQLEIPLQTVLYVAMKAKEYGKIVILDPAPAQAGLPDELFANIDILKPNEIELRMILGKNVNDISLEEAIEEVHRKGVETVLVTLGEKGSYLHTREGLTNHQFPEVVDVVDTTAAGDAFSASLAVALINGQSLIEAQAFANQVSSIVVTRKGAQSSIPSLDELHL